MVTLNAGKFSTKHRLNCIVVRPGYFRHVIFFGNIFIMTFGIILKIKQNHRREESYSIKIIRLQDLMGRQEVIKFSDF